MKRDFANGEEYFHRLYTIFNASIAITLLPMGWLLVLMLSDQLPTIELNANTYALIAAILGGALAILIGGRLNFAKSLKTDLITDQSLREKLNCYRQLCNKLYLRFFLGNALTVVGFYVTGLKIFIVGYVIGLILLSIKRPTVTAFIEDLKLDSTEKTILLEKQPIP